MSRDYALKCAMPREASTSASVPDTAGENACVSASVVAARTNLPIRRNGKEDGFTVSDPGETCVWDASPGCVAQHLPDVDDFEARAMAFWRQVNVASTDACWRWLGSRKANGYGSLTWAGKPRDAHRVALELALGRPIGLGLVVRHRCDTPACVRPDHLEEGTHGDNLRDSIDRGRRDSKLKLTDESADAIRISTEPAADLAARYGVSIKTVTRIRQGKAWSHIAPRRGAA